MFKKLLEKIKSFFRKLWDLLKYPYVKFKREREYRRRLKELRKRDPFIYK